MSIDATHASTAPTCASHRHIRSDLKSLGSDLQSGNVASAQADFASLLDDDPSLNPALPNGAVGAATAAATTPSSAADLLSPSLSSGDGSGAQSALASLPQSPRAGHQHHHHPVADATTSVDPTDPTALGSAAPGAQTGQADFQALSDALETGSLTGAPEALAQRQLDDRELTGGPDSNSSPDARSVI